LTLTVQQKEKLDNFGPFGSAIGGLIGFLIFICTIDKYGADPPFIEIILLSGPVLSYALNTCQHRRFILFSKAAFVGTIGYIVGFLVGLPLSYFLLPIWGFGYHALIPSAVCIVIFPYFLSKTVCRWEREKEIRTKYGFPLNPYSPQPYLPPQSTNPNCRFCNASMAYSKICPRCGRRNP